MTVEFNDPLTDQEKIAVWTECMEFISKRGLTTALTKHEWKTAIDSIDDWLALNMLEMKRAIPQPMRGKLTNRQIAKMFLTIVKTRIGDD